MGQLGRKQRALPRHPGWQNKVSQEPLPLHPRPPPVPLHPPSLPVPPVAASGSGEGSKQTLGQGGMLGCVFPPAPALLQSSRAWMQAALLLPLCSTGTLHWVIFLRWHLPPFLQPGCWPVGDGVMRNQLTDKEQKSGRVSHR